jgi:cysteinyl-tRNA synthetase
MSNKYLGKEFDIHGGGMDLAATHHTNEIAQSQACNHVNPARFWLHTNMLTVNSVRMSKSAGNGFLPHELFTGNHPLLERAYSPMTVRFFMMQTHYRSTLDFSNEALQAAEKGLKRLWEAYEFLQKLDAKETGAADAGLVDKVSKLLLELDEFMNDDFNTAKVLANMFELVTIINSLKDGHIKPGALDGATIGQMQTYFTNYLENILGLANEMQQEGNKLGGVMELLVEIRKEARARKDYATSDKIRNQLQALGITLKDDKDGGISISYS